MWRLLGAAFALLFALSAPAEANCAAANSAAVFYVTDRNAVRGTQWFGGERAIGANRVAVVRRGVAAEPITTRTPLDCGSQEAFWAALGRSFDPKRGRQLLLYVHGYYTSFKSAADSALRLRAALNFPGPVLLYSWPSKVTSRLSYVNDETNAGWSLVQFRSLLAQLASRYRGLRISFAAHSLGARFVADGISFLRSSRCANCVGRVALFAPDVDAATMYSELAADRFCGGPPKAKPSVSASVVLYVSNKDVALRQSQQFHGHQRAGQAGNEILLCNDVDTIDVGYLKLSDRVGHSYQTDARVLRDARAAFAGVSPGANSRKLQRVTRAGATYYELK